MGREHERVAAWCTVCAGAGGGAAGYGDGEGAEDAGDGRGGELLKKCCWEGKWD